VNVVGLVPMAHVADLPRSIAFYEKLGFTVGGSWAHEDLVALRAALVGHGIAVGEITHPAYMKEGEIRLEDPDGYVLLVGQTDS
jgi:catechol 2,3-dioxygenase-like lactoylglutathione lyase family enzyme